MIALNRPQPFIFIGWEVLAYKERFTSRNPAKLLILLRLGVILSDRPLGAVRPPGGTIRKTPTSDAKMVVSRRKPRLMMSVVTKTLHH
jgi:hypothetical protein